MTQQQAFATQFIELQKSTFDNMMSSAILVWNQTESALSTFLDHSPWVPEDGKKALLGLVESGITGLENFKNTVDENYTCVSSSILNRNPYRIWVAAQNGFCL